MLSQISCWLWWIQMAGGSIEDACSEGMVSKQCTCWRCMYCTSAHIYITCSEYVFTSFSHRRHLLWSIVNLFHHTHRYLTRNQHVKHKSMYTNFMNLVLCQNIFLQSMENVNSRWCTLSFRIGLAGTPLQGPKLSQGGVKEFEIGQIVRICGRLRSVHSRLHPTFPCTARVRCRTAALFYARAPAGKWCG